MSLQYPIYKGEIKNNLKLKKNASIQVSGSTTYSIDDYNNSLNPKGEYIGFRSISIGYENETTDSYPIEININDIENNTTKIYNPDNVDVYEDLVPIMSSDQQDGIILSCSYKYSNYNFYKAFDNNNDSYYSNYTNQGSQWLKIEFSSQEIVDKIYIYNAGDGGINYSLVISASNDDIEYTELYSSTSNLRNNIKYNIMVDTNTGYKYYKFNTNGKCEIRTMQLSKLVKNYNSISSVTVVNNTYSKTNVPVLDTYNTNNNTVSVKTENTSLYPYIRPGSINVPLEDKVYNYNDIRIGVPINVSNGYYGMRNITFIDGGTDTVCEYITPYIPDGWSSRQYMGYTFYGDGNDLSSDNGWKCFMDNNTWWRFTWANYNYQLNFSCYFPKAELVNGIYMHCNGLPALKWINFYGRNNSNENWISIYRKEGGFTNKGDAYYTFKFNNNEQYYYTQYKFSLYGSSEATLYVGRVRFLKCTNESYDDGILSQYNVTLYNNGRHDIFCPANYKGMGKVSVINKVEIPNLQNSKWYNIKENGVVLLKPDNGYDGVNETGVCINVVNDHLEEKTITIDDIENNILHEYDPSVDEIENELIPVMTSNVDNNISLYGNYSKGDNVTYFKMFDNNNSTYWSTAGNLSSYWFRVWFNNSVKVNKIYIDVKGRNGNNNWIKLYGSNDAFEYTLIYWDKIEKFTSNEQRIQFELQIENENYWPIYKFECYGFYDFFNVQFYNVQNRINGYDKIVLYNDTDKRLENIRNITLTSSESTSVIPSSEYYRGMKEVVITPNVLNDINLTLTLNNNRGYNYIDCPNGYVGMRRVTVYITNDPQYYTSKLKIYRYDYENDNYDLMNITTRQSMTEIQQENMWKIVSLNNNYQKAKIKFNSEKVIVILKYIRNDARIFVKVVTGISNGLSIIELDNNDVYAVVDKNNYGNCEFLLEHSFVEQIVRFNVKTSFTIIDGVYNELAQHELNDSHLNLDSNCEAVIFDSNNNAEISYGEPINYIITTEVNNANIDSYNNNIITRNGDYIIPNGYTGWNSFSVNVLPSELNVHNRTITIDTIENNTQQIITPTGEYINIMPAMNNNNYNNDEIILTGSSQSNNNGYFAVYKMFDHVIDEWNGFCTANAQNNGWCKIQFNEPKTFEYFNIYRTNREPNECCTSMKISGSNDDIDYVELFNDSLIYSGNSSLNNNLEFTGSYIYYYFEFLNSNNTWLNIVELELMKYQLYDGLNSVTIINNSESKVYKGYNENNRFYINCNGYGVITIPRDYSALGQIEYNVNVDVESNINNYEGYIGDNRLILNTLGEGVINIPSGYTGIGELHYDVAISKLDFGLEENKEVDVTENGVIEIEPSENYDAIQKLTLNISVDPEVDKIIGYVCNNFTLTYSGNCYVVSKGYYRYRDRGRRSTRRSGGRIALGFYHFLISSCSIGRIIYLDNNNPSVRLYNTTIHRHYLANAAVGNTYWDTESSNGCVYMVFTCDSNGQWSNYTDVGYDRYNGYSINADTYNLVKHSSTNLKTIVFEIRFSSYHTSGRGPTNRLFLKYNEEIFNDNYINTHGYIKENIY